MKSYAFDFEMVQFSKWLKISTMCFISKMANLPNCRKYFTAGISTGNRVDRRLGLHKLCGITLSQLFYDDFVNTFS